MSTKKEQIEEMKRVICEGAFDIAHRLYTAGYRKATDVVDEFVERLFNLSKTQGEHGIFTIKGWVENVKTIAAEMRKGLSNEHL